jgi:hypothetical protein
MSVKGSAPEDYSDEYKALLSHKRWKLLTQIRIRSICGAVGGVLGGRDDGRGEQVDREIAALSETISGGMQLVWRGRCGRLAKSGGGSRSAGVFW